MKIYKELYASSRPSRIVSNTLGGVIVYTDGEIPGSIPDMTNLENELFQIVSCMDVLNSVHYVALILIAQGFP